MSKQVFNRRPAEGSHQESKESRAENDKPREEQGEGEADDGRSYRPVVALFSLALLGAAAVSLEAGRSVLSLATLERCVALSLLMLSLLKLQDVRSFTDAFRSYDILARLWGPYAVVYPFGEATVALLMLSGMVPVISAPLALFIGSVGMASVIKAVWVDKRELKCACMGGDSRVPLGFVSFTENLAMAAMGIHVAASSFL